MRYLHMAWGLPIVVLLQCAISLLPKLEQSRQGSRYVDAAGFPVEADGCVSASWAAMWARYGWPQHGNSPIQT